MSNIFLTGYRATGKTTVANLIADAMGKKAIDADVYLEQKAGMTIAEIFAEEGEQGFRDRETDVVQELAARENMVVALGGGAILRKENCDALKGRGIIVWLTASAKVIDQRMNTDPLTGQRRPNLTSDGGLQEVQELLAKRTPFYQAVADVRVDTEQLSPIEVAVEVVNKITS
ncbi:MAG: shikimate kinase [Planctomycetota bacterium]|nr:shikimate kinase [Planctomycetota bacterium]